jgi:protein-S-isoprenylcysteine O-methyltransferase Ste14
VFSPGRRLTALYLAIQSLLGAAWWLILWLVPQSRTSFQPRATDADFILSFALADTLLFVLGSAAAASLFAINHRCARPALWLVAGATLYAALLCIGLAARGPGFQAPAALMLAAATCTTMLSLAVRRDEPTLPRLAFTPADPDSRTPIHLRIAAQIVLFWSIFLGAIPLGIAWCERSLAIPAMPSHAPAAAAIFTLGGAIGLWAASTMVRRGRGTPLPTDAPSRLVVSGPYAFVRNPMAVGGLAQGAAVALYLGSWLVLLYVLIGGLLWHTCIRPAEEADLRSRFGDPYLRYLGHVRCWIPRLRPLTDT